MKRAVLLLALSLSAVATTAPSLALAKRMRGVVIVEETKAEGRNRYRSLRDWEKTIQAYRGAYRDDKSVVWRKVDTPARVKAVYIENLRRDRGWDGINLYEAEGKVYIYVVPSDSEARASARTPSPKKLKQKGAEVPSDPEPTASTRTPSPSALKEKSAEAPSDPESKSGKPLKSANNP